MKKRRRKVPVFTMAQLSSVRSRRHLCQIIRRWRVLRKWRYSLYLAKRGLFGVTPRKRPFGFDVGDIAEAWSTPGGYPLPDGMSEGMQVRVIINHSPGGYTVERDGWEWHVDQTNLEAVGKRCAVMQELSHAMASWRANERWKYLFSPGSAGMERRSK